MSAIYVDAAQSVFKSVQEQKAIYNAYVKLLQDYGNFLADNNFHWTRPTRCFNRIYFKTDSSIDYFLFNISGKENNKLPAEIEKEIT